jgi:uncharacterized protein (TIGR02266 family)
MRIRLKYADVPTFVERFAPNVSRAGLFIASRTPKPVGTTVRFELTLADGKTKLLKGEGVVAWVREFDEDNPLRPHGMGVRFVRLDADSRQLIERIDAFKRERGVRDDGAVPQPAPPPAAAPVPVPIGRSARGDDKDGDGDDDDDDDDNEPSIPIRVRQPDAGESIEALLSVDGATIEEALQRARAIAARLVRDGAHGDDALDRLLAIDPDIDELPGPAPPPPTLIPPPPALILPPPPDEPASMPVAPPAATAATQAAPPAEPDFVEATRVSAPPLMTPDEPEPEAEPESEMDEERTRVRLPTPMPPLASPMTADAATIDEVADVLDAIARSTAAEAVPAPTAPPPGPDDTPSQNKPEKKGFFSKLFKK